MTGAALPGCTFQLRYLGGTSGTGGTVIGTKVTGKNGTAMWTGLNPGAYVLSEIKAPTGYVMDTASTNVVIRQGGDTQTLYFTNTPSTILVIEKYIEGTTTPLKGVTFLVTDSSGAVVGSSNGEYILSTAAGISLTAAIQFSKEECRSTCLLTNSRF